MHGLDTRTSWPGHTYFLGSCGAALTEAVLQCSIRRLASGYWVVCVGRMGVFQIFRDL